MLTTVPNPAAVGQPAPGSTAPQKRPPLRRDQVRAAVLAGALGGGVMALSLTLFSTVLLLALAFGSIIVGAAAVSAFAGVPFVSELLEMVAGSTPLAGAFSLMAAAVVVLVLIGAGVSAWLLRGFGAGLAWAITGLGHLAAMLCTAVLGTGASGLLAVPLLLLPQQDYGGSDAFTTTAWWVAGASVELAALILACTSALCWWLMAHIMRPRASPRR